MVQALEGVKLVDEVIKVKVRGTSMQSEKWLDLKVGRCPFISLFPSMASKTSELHTRLLGMQTQGTRHAAMTLPILQI